MIRLKKCVQIQDEIPLPPDKPFIFLAEKFPCPCMST